MPPKRGKFRANVRRKMACSCPVRGQLHSPREIIMAEHVTSVRSIRIVRRFSTRKVNVEVGTGAIAPKVAIQRRKAQAPVKVEVGTGAIAPKVAIQRRKS